METPSLLELPALSVSTTLEDAAMPVTFSLKVSVMVSVASNLPSLVPFVSLTAVITGLALSAGAWAANELWLPAESRTPEALAASATRKEPTEVSAALAPSAIVSVAVAPLEDTEDSDPPLGTAVSVHGAVAVVPEMLSENVALTWSILPSLSLSNICSVESAGAALSVGVTLLNEAALLPAASAMPPDAGAV